MRASERSHCLGHATDQLNQILGGGIWTGALDLFFKPRRRFQHAARFQASADAWSSNCGAWAVASVLPRTCWKHKFLAPRRNLDRTSDTSSGALRSVCKQNLQGDFDEQECLGTTEPAPCYSERLVDRKLEHHLGACQKPRLLGWIGICSLTKFPGESMHITEGETQS